MLRIGVLQPEDLELHQVLEQLVYIIIGANKIVLNILPLFHLNHLLDLGLQLLLVDGVG